MVAPDTVLMPPTGRAAALIARLKRIPGARYWAAAALVLISLWGRVQLSPYLAGYGYICFYPGVILSAYWLGGRPGLMAAGLSTVIVYNFMGPAPFSFPTDGQAMVGLGLFLVSSLLLIHVLSTIRARLNTLTTKHAQVEALAMGQAELFRDHAQRTTDHLQLISAILQLRAREEADPLASQVLTTPPRAQWSSRGPTGRSRAAQTAAFHSRPSRANWSRPPRPAGACRPIASASQAARATSRWNRQPRWGWSCWNI